MTTNKLPLVSIVTPTYNQAEFLVETIESVLAQTYPYIEYIIINDGSTDGTEKILSDYKERCVTITQDNCGQSETLNRAWSKANGTILAYISSDDWLKPNCVELAVKAMLECSGVVGVYCDFELIDNKGKYIRTVESENFDRNRLLIDLVCQPGPGAFFYKSAFEKVGGWKTDLKQIPDFDFWVRLSGEGDLKRIPLPLADFRIHEGSSSFRPVTPERSDEIVRIVEEYAEFLLHGKSKRLARSNAYAFSARSHFQSLRFICGFKALFCSFKENATGFMSLSRWKFILSGAVRRVWYLAIRS